MRRILKTSVAFSALLAGAAFTAPSMTTGVIAPAHAQEDQNQVQTQDEGAAGGEEMSGDDMQESGSDSEIDSGSAEEAESAADGNPSSEEIEDGDEESPVTTTGDTDDADNGAVENSEAEDRADEILTDTEETGSDDGMSDDDAAATEGSGEMFVDMQEDGQVSANRYIGQSLYNMNDESIGSINDLIFTVDGGVEAAIVGVGGFLGIGEKNVGVHFDMIDIVEQEQAGEVRLVTDASREALENAPEYMTLEEQEAQQNQAQPATNTGGGMTDGGTGTGMGGTGTGTGTETGTGGTAQ